MHTSARSLRKYTCVAIACGALIAAPAGSVWAQDEQDEWYPRSVFEGKFDWIQMTSGEWVKGKILVMFKDNLEFDSDEFDDLVLDWGDIQQIRSSKIMNVGFNDRTSATGILIVDGDKVTIVGEDEVRETTKNEVLSITAGAPKEINFWSMKIFFGLIIRSGNSDVREVNAQATFKRQTIRNRIVLDFVGNQNVTDGVDVSDNQRAAASWDHFINRRFFINPLFGEYFRDPFSNIAAKYTIGTGAGYQLIDSVNVDWDVSGGPAYQETRYDSVAEGENETENTPALVVNTFAEWDITKWLEFDGQYRMQLVNEESGKYNHHMVASFETEITSLIDFDVSFIWDRIQDPRANSEGIVPQQDDYRTTVGLTFDF